jgi:hypothetical protein
MTRAKSSLATAEMIVPMLLGSCIIVWTRQIGRYHIRVNAVAPRMILTDARLILCNEINHRLAATFLIFSHFCMEYKKPFCSIHRTVL